jgi:hypothetical protein
LILPPKGLIKNGEFACERECPYFLWKIAPSALGRRGRREDRSSKTLLEKEFYQKKGLKNFSRRKVLSKEGGLEASFRQELPRSARLKKLQEKGA